MVLWWITTLGILLCLGLAGGVLFYGLNGALNSRDSITIDRNKD